MPLDSTIKLHLWGSQETLFSPNAGTANSGDSFGGLGHTCHQQLKEILQHGVDHALIPDVYRKE